MLRRPLRAAVLATLVAAAVVLLPTGPAAAETCATTQVAAGWSATVCLSVPSGPLAGDVAVAATVRTSTGAPGVRDVEFRLDGGYLLSDRSSPFGFRLPTGWSADGAHTLSAQAVHWDGTRSATVSVSRSFANGRSTGEALSSGTFTPRGRQPAAGAPLLVAATGDAAGGRPQAAGVSDLVASWQPDVFLYLGDVYSRGSRAEFDNWYGRPDELFGRFADVTNPTVGNHEYDVPGAHGYRDYWDNVPSWYSYDRGGWHFVSVDSTTDLGQVTAGTEQFEWLREDLLSSPGDCTLVYFHHPVRSIGDYSGDRRLDELWRLLADAGVDLVLTGHDHNYQRWAPLDRDGRPAPGGTVQLVAGGGGHGVYPATTQDDRVLASATTEPDAVGALRMQLTPTGGSWSWTSSAGRTVDTSSLTCSPSPAGDETAPSAPSGATGEVRRDGRVRLAWRPSTDDRGVSHYEVLRDGAVVRSTTATAALVVAPPGRHLWSVRAVDVAGNRSAPSAAVRATTPTALLLSDGFESGDLRAWTSSSGLRVAAMDGDTGSWAARPASTGAASWARRALPTAYPEVGVRARVTVVSRGSSSCWLVLRSADGPVADLCTDASGRLYTWDYGRGAARTSGVVVPPGGWHRVELRLRSGASGRLTVLYDGAEVPELAVTGALAPVKTVQVGLDETGRSYVLGVDDVQVRNSASAPGATTAPPVFTDGFESGDLSAWQRNVGMTAGTSQRFSGGWGARAASDGPAEYARRGLGAGYADLWTSARVKVLARGDDLPLLQVRTSSAAPLAALFAGASGRLGLVDQVNRVATLSSAQVGDGRWHLLELRTVVDGASSRLEVRLDGAPVTALTRRAPLGSAGAGTVQIARNSATSRGWDVAFDDVRADVRPRP